MSGAGLLVVAGEPSGDRIAAAVLSALGPAGDGAFGIGGPSCRRAGLSTLADLTAIGAMGIGDVLGRLPALALAARDLGRRALATPPRAALLVNFTELNAHLGRALRRRGTRVLWCVAPQVWAWRKGRLRTLRDAVDRLAVILPFEEQLWRDAGYDARFVGHPVLDIPALGRPAARRALGLAPEAIAVAVLPGSRKGEVERLSEPLCEAAARLRAEGRVSEARLLAAPWLDPRTRAAAARAASRHGIPVADADPEHGAAPLLGAFDLGLCASGTACLEAALAGLPTVIAYRLDPLAYAVGRRLVRVPHIGLPNVLLGRRASPELLQDNARGPAIAAASRAMLTPEARAQAQADATALRAMLMPPGPLSFAAHVAALLKPWLA